MSINFFFDVEITKVVNKKTESHKKPKKNLSLISDSFHPYLKNSILVTYHGRTAQIRNVISKYRHLLSNIPKCCLDQKKPEGYACKNQFKIFSYQMKKS